MKLIVKLFGKNIFEEDNPYAKKVLVENYYSLTVICKNCKKSTNVFIKKGVNLNDVIFEARCHYCNCRLEKQEI